MNDDVGIMKEPTRDDIRYIINQIAEMRNKALFVTQSEIYNETECFYRLTDDLQSFIDYLADYFGVQKA